MTGWLRQLDVRDFRNLERVELALPSDGIAVIGDNGQGKTSLLEAIYYLHLLRSLRGARDTDVVRFGTSAFHVRADLGDRTVAIGFQRAGQRKRVTLDGVEPPRLADALGAVASVTFSPADVALVRGAPGERRRYLDVMLGVTSRPYLRALQSYRGALVRRNAALRSGKGEGPIAVWEPPLAEHGTILWRERSAWLDRARPSLARLVAAIGERGTLGVRYASPLNDAPDPTAALRAALEQGRAHDVRRGMTHAGPHRDDISLALDGHDLRVFGSAGQQRTVAIAMRMMEAETLREHVGTAPLLLLDDPFAELDAGRANRILCLLRERGVGQTVLTVPRASDIPPELTNLERWRMEAGAMTRHD